MAETGKGAESPCQRSGGRKNPDERGLGSYIAVTQPQDLSKVGFRTNKCNRCEKHMAEGTSTTGKQKSTTHTIQGFDVNMKQHGRIWLGDGCVRQARAASVSFATGKELCQVAIVTIAHLSPRLGGWRPLPKAYDKVFVCD